MSRPVPMTRGWAVMLPVVAVVVTAAPLVANNYVLSVLIPMLVFTALAYAWNIISGYTGYLSFGQVTFFGIGAYTAALLIIRLHLAWPLASLAGVVLAALVAVPLGCIMLRRRGPYSPSCWDSPDCRGRVRLGAGDGRPGLYLPLCWTSPCTRRGARRRPSSGSRRPTTRASASAIAASGRTRGADNPHQHHAREAQAFAPSAFFPASSAGSTPGT